MLTKTEKSVSMQAQRRRLLGQLIRKQILPSIQRQGDQVVLDLGEHAGDVRLVQWIARSLLGGSAEDQLLANQLLASAECDHASHFCGATAMALLSAEKNKLSRPVIEKLERFVSRYLSDWMTDDYRFHGANDNAPFECVTILSLAGAYFQQPTLVAFARQRLKQLDRLLDLRGYIHECNSPTYSAVSLAALADLVELGQDAETKRMALRAEQRIWQELLLHFHPLIKHQIGPFSRGYPDDNANQCTMAMIALYCAFGEVSPFNPAAMLFPPTPGTFAHNAWVFQWASCAQLAAPTYHPPLELAAGCFQREIPFASLGSNEYMPIAGAPCGQTTVQVYAEADWVLSSFGSRIWAGQTVPLHALYRRKEVSEQADVVEKLAAIRSVYTRFHVTESFGSLHARCAKQALPQIALDHAAAFCVQHQGTALLGYVPIAGPEKVRTMKTSVVFPLHHSRPDETWHGDRRIAGFSASFSDLNWAFVRDGDIYLAFHPLLAKQQDAMLCSQQYEDDGECGLISFYSMCGFETTDVSAQQRRTFGSGLVMEISSKHSHGSFEKFRKAVLTSRMEQRQFNSQRELRYTRDGVDLELIFDFQQLSLRRAAASGEIVSNAVKLETRPPLPLLD